MSWNAALTHISLGARRASWLLIICPKHWAVSPAPRDCGASLALLLCYIQLVCQKNNKKTFHIRHGIGSSALRLNTEVRGEKLILYVYGSQTKRSTLIAVLIITTCTDFLTTHWLLTAPTFSSSGEGGCVQCFGRPGVVLALPYSNKAQGAGMIWSDTAAPKGICFPICFQHLFNLSTSQPGWSRLPHIGA